MSKIIFQKTAANNNAGSNTALSILTKPIDSTDNVVKLPPLDLKAEFDAHYARGDSIPEFIKKHPNLSKDVILHISRVARKSVSKLNGLISYINQFGAWSEIESERIIAVFVYIGYEEDYSGRCTKQGTYTNPNGKAEVYYNIYEIVQKIYGIFRDMNMTLEINAIKFALDSELNYRKTVLHNAMLESIKFDGNERSEEWSAMANYFFDMSDQSEEYVIGVLKKFIHQVKTKLNFKNVDNHLMPVLFGSQKVGKSYFIENLICAPLTQMIKKTDFSTITDARNGELWKAPIILLDEMQHVGRADIDAIKNKITTSTVDFRPMGTNKMTSTTNCATFIGSANADNLNKLVKDTTGNRRFAPLRYRKTKPDVETVFDFIGLWKSIDPKVDPSNDNEFMRMLEGVQSEHRYFTNVASWFEEYASTEAGQIKRATIKDVREEYNIWCKNNGEVPVKVAYFKSDLAAYLALKNEYKIISPKNIPTLVLVEEPKIVDMLQ